MTAPTPSTDEQIVASLRNLTPRFGTEEEAADRIEALVAALATVTAERAQARQKLEDAPHHEGCLCLNVLGQACRLDRCSCWKAGL
jgi:hypothetical protein